MNTIRKSAFLTVVIALLTVSVTLLAPQTTQAQHCGVLFVHHDLNGNYAFTSEILYNDKDLGAYWNPVTNQWWLPTPDTRRDKLPVDVVSVITDLEGRLSVLSDGQLRLQTDAGVIVSDSVQIYQRGTPYNVSTTSDPNRCDSGGFHNGG